MNEIMPLLVTVEHIKVNARNRRQVEAIIKKHEGRFDWLYWLIPILVAILGIVGLFKII